MSVSVTWHGGQVEAEAEAAAKVGLKKALEHLKAVSSDRAPHEEGILEGTASVSTDGMVGAVSFDTPYAARQHEELTWRHDPGKTAKYLEGPMIEERDALLELIATEVRRGLGT